MPRQGARVPRRVEEQQRRAAAVGTAATHAKVRSRDVSGELPSAPPERADDGCALCAHRQGSVRRPSRHHAHELRPGRFPHDRGLHLDGAPACEGARRGGGRGRPGMPRGAGLGARADRAAAARSAQGPGG